MESSIRLCTAIFTLSPMRARSVGPGPTALLIGGTGADASQPRNWRRGFALPTFGMSNLPLNNSMTPCSVLSASLERISGGITRVGLPSCASASGASTISPTATPAATPRTARMKPRRDAGAWTMSGEVAFDSPGQLFSWPPSIWFKAFESSMNHSSESSRSSAAIL